MKVLPMSDLTELEKIRMEKHQLQSALQNETGNIMHSWQSSTHCHRTK